MRRDKQITFYKDLLWIVGPAFHKRGRMFSNEIQVSCQFITDKENSISSAAIKWILLSQFVVSIDTDHFFLFDNHTSVSI